jgi:hypothetical protein
MQTMQCQLKNKKFSIFLKGAGAGSNWLAKGF